MNILDTAENKNDVTMNILDTAENNLIDSTTKTEDTNFDVILRVKPQKIGQITSQIIDGKKCIIIPMEEDEHANVNGVTNLL